MNKEKLFLHRLTALLSTSQLLSQALRWGHEGCLTGQERLPELAIKLQECTEKLLILVNARCAELGTPENGYSDHEKVA
ncbi:MAG: hypothetical protein ACXVB9_04095 [Bdellovibrionota bacterium]